MTVHQRNISASIDPVKLDRLAEVAVRVGLQPAAGAGPAADGADRGAAAGAPDRRACLQGRRRPRDADPVGRGDHAGALSLRARMPASIAPPAGSMRACRRPSPPTPRGSPSSATIRCCWRARIRPRSRAPARPIRWPISRRWRRSSASTSTGTSSPIRARPGRSRCFRTMRRTSRWRSWPTRSSRPRASTRTTPSRPGRSTTRRCASAPNG